MEDDHVDRRRVDVQQCMKLSLTNSPIGLIVLIDHAHQRAFGAVMMPFLVLTLTHPSDAPLRTARATRRDGHLACTGATSISPGHQGTNRRVKKPASRKHTDAANVGGLPLADLVVMAGRPHPFPFRTRP